jgi:phosphatidylglycerophosphate synthase
MRVLQQIRGVFSDRYSNHAAIGNNVLLAWMYRFAYPFAVMLSAMRLSPNQITTLSIAFTIAAAYILATGGDGRLFVLLWGLALLMDFCDGTVARMTNKVRKTAFRYDHTSDLFKFFLIILAVGLRYDDRVIWLFALSALFLFMFYMVINHDLSSVRRQLTQTVLSAHHQASDLRLAGRGRRFFKALYAALMTINGHTLLLMFVFPFGRSFALVGMGYLASVSLFRVAVSIWALMRLPK